MSRYKFAWLVVLLLSLFFNCKSEPDIEKVQTETRKIKSSNSPVIAEVGKQAPQISLPALGGGDVKFSSSKGKVVFVNFWATWCAPCIEEMPLMEVLHRRFSGGDFVMLAVSIDTDESSVSEFISKYRLTFEVLLDKSQEVSSSYGITGVPETFIIDRDGLLVRKEIGPQNWSSQRNMLYFKKLLSGE